MKAEITITLKKQILDPEGEAIRKSLNNLNFSNIKGLRSGKYFVIEIDTEDKTVAKKTIENICNQLLVNQLIEDYEYKLI